MSRPLNRALIESSLEMKCMLFFFISLSIVIGVSFLLYYGVTRQIVLALNPIMANTWAEQYLQEAHWEAFANSKPNNSATSNEILLAPITKNTNVSEFRQKMEGIMKRIQNSDWKAVCIANPEKLSELYFNDFDIAEQEERKKRTEQDWKTYASVLKKFPFYLSDSDFQHEKTLRYEFQFDNKRTYHYFEEVRMNRGDSECAVCHDFAQGELMGVIHVEIPESSVKKVLQRYWAYMLAAAIVSAFLAMVAVYIVIRLIVIKPLKNLREVSESISRGELSKRADIRTGDEFEVLAEAFNRMLRHLVNSQDMLRKANNELGSKVDELAYLTIQLYETNRVKSDFMATMSHELRTPLNSILGFSDVLGSISTLNEKQKRYVENINKSGRSLLSMINDILDMAKMEAGRMDIQTVSFNIAATVAAQADMAKPLVDRKNIDLETIIELNLPPMKQDESRIQQILNNLLSNAIKFTPEGGRIRLTIQRLPAVPIPVTVTPVPIAGAAAKIPRNRDMLEIKVTDTGVGISEEDQQVIFEKFRQGKNTMTEGDAMKREHSGSGLGLSIVKEICKMLEGEIMVESQLGIGSTFTVRLPWILESKARAGSEMMAEIQQFAQNRVVRQKEDSI
ncbi:MAG: HAMP domain-containing histidine kinase [Planctomycetaceae bacterium]|jgi:signal transduction histidine kinase|nr:HAMP domain-containing histidine kinase [Planctomycetaceae bacterium]